jgi:RNA polymerase sigma-70 factor (ECF subfamily)
MPVVTDTEIARVFTQEYGRAVAVLARVFGDIDIAQDAVRTRSRAAVSDGRQAGLPPSPAGWIITTARNRANRSASARKASRDDRHAEAALLQAQDEPFDEGAVPDDRLRLIFTCCHPALGIAAQVALTLRLLGGLTTAEIARAFLVPEATMASGWSAPRARFATLGSRIACRSRPTFPIDCAPVLAVVYLIFNEGYTASSGERLGARRPVHGGDPPGTAAGAADARRTEVLGLLALMLLVESRRATRTTPDGDLVRLADQDRDTVGPSVDRRRPGHRPACLRRNHPAPIRSRRRSTPCTATRRRGSDGLAQILQLL